MKILYTTILSLCIMSASAQNVGIGTTTPAEKLDVNGNINVTGSIKLNGNEGTSGQVLMKDGSNTTVWGDISSRYRNLVVFDCGNTATSTGGSNCSVNWNVPAGVTQVFVECWGGGGGGGVLCGGSSGGYISAIITTVAGNAAVITIGAGGNYGTSTINGISGGITTLSLSGTNLTATGGVGGRSGDLFASTNYGVSPAGTFSSNATSNVFGLYGQCGFPSKTRYDHASATEYVRITDYGKGGDAPLYRNSGGNPGYSTQGNGFNSSIFASPSAPVPGAGGGADKEGGYIGRGGRVIIHY